MTQVPSALAPTPAVFQFHSLDLRAFADDNGEPWICAADVCAILGYANSRQAVQKNCLVDGVSKRDAIDAMGRTQETTYINEGNLYRLIVKSRKPEAQAFERKVMEEILPAIRKTGAYAPASATPPATTPDTPLLTRGQVGQIVRVINQRATALHGSANEIGRKLLARCEAETYDDIPAWRFDATMKWLKSLTHADVATHHPSLEEVHSGAIAAAAGHDKEWKLPSGRPGEKWVVAFDAEGKPTIAPYRPPRVLPALMAFNLGRECIGNFSSLSDLGSKTEKALTLHPENLPHILVTAFRYFADEENLPDVGLFAERLAEYLGEMNRRAIHGAMKRGA